MSNSRELSRLDAARDLALRDGDTEAAARYEARINELLKEDMAKVRRRGQHRITVPKEYFLMLGELNN